MAHGTAPRHCIWNDRTDKSHSTSRDQTDTRTFPVFQPETDTRRRAQTGALYQSLSAGVCLPARALGVKLPTGYVLLKSSACVAILHIRGPRGGQERSRPWSHGGAAPGGEGGGGGRQRATASAPRQKSVQPNARPGWDAHSRDRPNGVGLSLGPSLRMGHGMDFDPIPGLTWAAPTRDNAYSTKVGGGVSGGEG